MMSKVHLKVSYSAFKLGPVSVAVYIICVIHARKIGGHVDVQIRIYRQKVFYIEQVFDGIQVGTRGHQHAPFMDILLCAHFCIYSYTPDLLG